MTKNFLRKFISVFLCIALVMTYVPITVIAANSTNTIVDPSTADSYADMLGTNEDGNRYAGRVWVDKSVFNTDVDLDGIGTVENDSDFLVAYSALGSTTSVSTTTNSGSSNLDVVVILDNSASMGRYSTGTTTRLETVTSAANELLSSILNANGNNRVAVVTYSTGSTVLLPLDYYSSNDEILSVSISRKPSADANGGVQVTSGDGKMTASAYSLTSQKTISNTNTGYQMGTYLQAGIDTGMSLLSERTDATGRTPVVIVLTDGVADMAVRTNWYGNVANGSSLHPESNTLTSGVALGTLLNASYNKAAIEDTYGKLPTVYGIGVDIASEPDALIVMNPKENFVDATSGLAGTTWTWYNQWVEKTDTLQKTDNVNSRYTWNFEQLPTGSAVTKNDIQQNIAYIDQYYAVDSSEVGSLEDTFGSIVETITSGGFHPITDTVEQGGVEAETPLTYVDFIGEYMEVKDFKALTLYGKTYEITAGTTTHTDENMVRTETTPFTVVDNNATITHPVMNYNFILSECVSIELIHTYPLGYDDDGTLVRTGAGTQELWIYINEEALPLVYSQVVNNQGTTYTTNKDDVDPIRVYYTVGASAYILDENGEIDASMLDAEYVAKYGYNLYSNRFGEMNQADSNGNLTFGDAHASFTPSAENRYYYHQSNYPVFSGVSLTSENRALTSGDWDEGEYGVLYYENGAVVENANGDPKYSYTTMTLEYLLNNYGIDPTATVNDNEEVYTIIAFYRPDDVAGTEAVEAEDVAYIAYTTWADLKNSITFYDSVNGVYLNYDINTHSLVTSDTGVTTDLANATEYVTLLQNYATNNGITTAQIHAYLGIGSQRVSRLHNMESAKTNNATNTATDAYGPVYNDITGSSEHVGSIVVWLGNNGVLSVTPPTPVGGIHLEKTVDVESAESNAPTSFEFTVTLENGTDMDDVVITDADGNTVAGWVVNGTTITGTLANGEDVYINGIPAGTEYTVTETEGRYYTAASVNSNGTIADNTFAEVQFTNTAVKFNDLIVSKDILHPDWMTDITALEAHEFTINVEVAGAEANTTYTTSDSSINLTTDANGSASATITLKDAQALTIYNLPAGAEYSVEEINVPDGYTSNTEAAAITGVIPADSNAIAGVLNDYQPDAVQTTVTITGTKTFLTSDGTEVPESDWPAEGFTVELYSVNSATGEASLVKGDIKVNASNKTWSVDVPLEFTQTGTYFYKIAEVIGNNSDITYDRSLGLFQIVVTDDGTGALKISEVASIENTATITNNADGYTVDKDFTNYKDAGKVLIEVNKNIEGSDSISANDFLFGLYDSSDNLVDTVSGNGSFMIAGYGADFATPKAYTIRELIPEVENMMLGITYDTTVYNVSVVWNDTVGNLVATVEGTTDNIATFTNVYNDTVSTPAIELGGTKTINGDRTTFLDGESYTFELYETGADFAITGASVQSDTVSGNDYEYSFDGLTFNAEGTYYYVVKEAVGNQGGVTYDSTEYHVVIHVNRAVDNNRIILKASATVVKFGTTVTVNTDKLDFTNTYNVTGNAELNMEGIKYYKDGNNDRALAGGEFAFGLYDGTNLLDWAVNDANGNFAFDTITYNPDDIGSVFTYTVKEIGTHPVYVNSDSTVYTVTVEVVDNGDGTVGLITNYTNTLLTFTNRLDRDAFIDIEISGTKTLTGRNIVDGEFSFQLYASDETGAIGTTPLQTVVNDGNGFTFVLENMDNGTYHYVIKEVEGKAGGVAYDTSVYFVTVTVALDENDVQQYRTAVTKGRAAMTSLEFVNHYTTEGTTVNVSGHKTLKGKALTANAFEFEILDAEKDSATGTFEAIGAPLATAAVNADGSFAFRSGNFNNAGTYYYVIRETLPEGVNINENGDYTLNGITYDITEYWMTVVVTDNGDGTLSADTEIINGTTGVAYENNAITFENSYSTTDATASLSGNKTLTGRTLNANEFAFLLYNADSNFVIDTDTSAITAYNRADGTFTFEALDFNEAKTYYFVVAEDTTTDVERITYDDAVYYVSIDVTDNGEGELVAAAPVIRNAESGEIVEAIEFENIFTPRPEDISIDIAVEKTVVNKGSESIGPEGFEFVLENVETEEKLYAESDEDGNAMFTLSYTEDDIGKVYTYKLTEVNDNRENVQYSTEEYIVSVEVSLNEDNELVATISVDGEDVEQAVAEFENVYDYTPEEPEEPQPETPDEPEEPQPEPEPETPDEPNEPQPVPDPEIPNTDVAANLSMWFAALFVSGGMAGTFLIGKKKKEENAE